MVESAKEKKESRASIFPMMGVSLTPGTWESIGCVPTKQGSKDAPGCTSERDSGSIVSAKFELLIFNRPSPRGCCRSAPEGSPIASPALSEQCWISFVPTYYQANKILRLILEVCVGDRLKHSAGTTPQSL